MFLLDTNIISELRKVAKGKNQKKGEILRSWNENTVFPKFQKKILDIDLSVLRCCAKLHIHTPEL